MLGETAMTRKSMRRLEVIHPDCAGVDVGGSRHYVAVDPGRSDEPVRSFGTFTDELEAMGRWLAECGVRIVAMESTGVYWIPVYEVLERMGFEVHLVNPRATKQVSGRKSDVLDCQWIWQLMSYGLLKGAFRPADEVCELRSYVRQRARLVRDRSRCVQHIQKALTEMNVQLANVLSDVTGKTGMRILRAIVAGERDGAKLAALRDGRVRADEETLARSLRGTWRAEHVFALAQAVERYDFFETQIGRCEAQILSAGESLSKDVEAGKRGSGRAWATRMRVVLHRMLGVDLTAIPTIGLETALAVASELGSDLSRFASCAHFCSWLQLAPGTRISGGKPLPGRAPAAVNRLGQALRVAATTARSSQSFIGASHRARLSRLDKPRAIKATAHQLARLIYAMLTRGEEYVERGIAHYEAVRRDRQLRALQRRAHHMGLTLIDQPS
jgi:transposase